MKVNTGYIVDYPDSRDRMKIAKAADLANKSSMKEFAGEPYDQGQIGSCTGQAFCKLMEMVDQRVAKDTGGRVAKLSPLFQYALAREKAGWPDEDRGAFLRDAFKQAKSVGTLARDMYRAQRFLQWENIPNDEEKGMAKFAQLQAYERISVYSSNLIDSIRYSIDIERLPIVFGVALFDGFFNQETKYNGVVRVPETDETQRGSHAMVIYGYNHIDQVFFGINSWGYKWGDGGHFIMPYSYFIAFCHDVWTIGFKSY